MDNHHSSFGLPTIKSQLSFSYVVKSNKHFRPWLKVNIFVMMVDVILSRKKVLSLLKTQNVGHLKSDQALMIIENCLALTYITHIITTQINHTSLLIITFTRGFGVLG